MLATLFFLFIVIPAVDLFLLLQIGSWIGIYNTLALIVATGLFGAILYRTQTWFNMRKMQRALEQGQVPDRELLDSILIILGAILLVTPGVLTDLLGFLVLLPFTRPFIRKGIIWWLKKKLKDGSITVQAF